MDVVVGEHRGDAGDDGADIRIAKGVSDEDDRMLNENREQLRSEIRVAGAETLEIRCGNHKRLRLCCASVDLIDLRYTLGVLEEKLVLSDIGHEIREDVLQDLVEVGGDDAFDGRHSKCLELVIKRPDVR